MAFRFTKEDFERYVKMDEHEGRHIWHELQERLESEFSVPFAQAPFIARGDRLRTIWFSPKAGPRSKWDNQAQFFLARNIEEKRLFFGLMIECPPLSDVTKSGYDPDRDGLRLIAQLERNPGFVDQLDRLANQTGWEIVVNEWSEQWHTIRSGAQLLDVLGGMPDGQGWGVHVQRVLTAERAVDAGAAIADRIMEAYRTVRPLWEALIPEAVRIFLETGETTGSPKPSIQEVPSLTSYFSSQGFWFSPLTLATYFTALQTKGFVILSGLSGTGKTKLAQHFADLLSGLTQPFPVSVKSTFYKEGRVTLPKGTKNRFRYIPELGQNRRLIAQFAGQWESCTLGHYREESPVLQLTLKEKASEWLRENFEIDDKLQIFVKGDILYLETPPEKCDIFLSVRPDWRDSRGLLGYYNPLNEKYESTKFMQFMLQACGNYQASLHELKWEAEHPNAGTLLAEPNAFITDTVRLGLRAVNVGGQVVSEGTFEFTVNERRQLALPGRISDLQTFRNAAKIYAVELDRVSAHFVLLDEMNLARVEYYFADLLSVLESGRRPDGLTKEAIRLEYPLDAEGDVPPRELFLPPNLYFTGTVNVDETTHAFSPKVLDRAFTIEITDVDLERYPAEIDVETDGEESVALTERLLPVFTRNGRFGIVDKSEIRAFVAAHPEYRSHLDRLKNLLQPYDLHFAYRVFDEIISFCANARANGLWADLGGLETAFDCAVLMKVLPKFHGPRGKLEQPLRNILAWTLSPDSLGHAIEQVKELTKDADTCLKLRRQLDAYVSGQDSTAFRYPHTARKVVRMLQALHASGFASFA